MHSFDWFTIGRIGLLYDLTGALILVWGYVLQGKTEFQQATAFFGPHEPIQPVTTKFDSIVGLTFIMLDSWDNWPVPTIGPRLSSHPAVNAR